MNTIEALMTRKSVRSYLEKAVEDEKIRRIVEAAEMASGSPMSGKRYFTAISNKAILKRLAENTKEIMQRSGNPMLEKLSANPAYNPIYNAPVAVVITTDKPADEQAAAMLTANAACAGENMLIAARELGLGSCYLVSPTLAFMKPDMRKAVNMSESTVPQAVIVFGYSKDTSPHAAKEFENITYIK